MCYSFSDPRNRTRGQVLIRSPSCRTPEFYPGVLLYAGQLGWLYYNGVVASATSGRFINRLSR